jgi:two-component system sensor histidine kinase BaeS
MGSTSDEGLVLGAPEGPDLAAAARGSWAGLAIGLTVGLLLDAAVRSGPGLALTFVTWVSTVAILVLIRPRRAAWPFLFGAVVLGALFSLRTSPGLVALDVLGAGALLCVGAGFAVAGDPSRTTTRAYVVRSIVAPVSSTPDGVAGLRAPLTRGIRPRTSPRALARIAIVVLPVAFTLIALFGSADPVFRSYVHVPGIDPAAWAGHLVWIVVGAIGVATLLAIGAGRAVPLEEAAERRLQAGWLRPGEWIALLIVVDVLFALFVAVQFAVFFGGRERVLSVEGLTYAEYARGGFWQLIGAASIAGGTIALGWLALARPDPGRYRGIFLGLSLPLIGLVGVVLVSAFDRLSLYEDAYGLTRQRVLVHLTIVDLGLVFACVVVALVRWRASWLPAAAIAIATVSVVALNLWNVDAHIAARNLAQAQHDRPLDAATLATLSDDAVPTLVASLPDLAPKDRATILEILSCRSASHSRTDISPANANLAWSHADQAMDSVPLPVCDRAL